MVPMTPQPFLRSHDDRVIGGVAGGLGKAFGVDPIIFRIALAALVFAGGVGIVAYAAALLLVPAEDADGNALPREHGWPTLALAAGGVLLFCAALAVLGAGGGFLDGGWLFPLAVLVGVGYAVRRGRGADRPPLVRLLVLAAIGAAILGGLGVAFWGSAWATAAGGGVVVASVVLALGAALLAGAVRGDRRARWLAVPALVIAFPAGIVSAADISLDGGVGERTYRPTGADPLPAGYELGAGELVVDLRSLDWKDGKRRALRLQVGVGHAVVLVPATVCVGARSTIGMGYADVFGRDAGGIDLDHDVARAPATGRPGLTLDVHMGMGEFEVLYRDPQVPYDAERGSRRFRGDRGDVTDGAVADRACAGSRA